MPTNQLLDVLKNMVEKERKIKEFKQRLRIKGRVFEKNQTRKGNITLTIKRDDVHFKFTILKSHKERFALAEKIKVGTTISIAGIPKLRMIICTYLKVLEKGLPEGKQMVVGDYDPPRI